MTYSVFDTANHQEASSFASLAQAIAHIRTCLQQEEAQGRVICREDAQRWAVYDGLLTRLLWIESDAAMRVTRHALPLPARDAARPADASLVQAASA